MEGIIKRAEEFLHHKFNDSSYFREHPGEKAYRLEHSIRVANIGAAIARQEGMDTEAMAIACLLHDVSYCRGITAVEDWKEHGREAARIARPFLESLHLPEHTAEQIMYGIAAHVDGKTDFAGEPTAFTETVCDADNIDRYDVYRLFENLSNNGFMEMTLDEKEKYVVQLSDKLSCYRDEELATETATLMWREKINFQLTFFEHMERQLKDSRSYRLPA